MPHGWKAPIGDAQRSCHQGSLRRCSPQALEIRIALKPVFDEPNVDILRDAKSPISPASEKQCFTCFDLTRSVTCPRASLRLEPDGHSCPRLLRPFLVFFANETGEDCRTLELPRSGESVLEAAAALITSGTSS